LAKIIHHVNVEPSIDDTIDIGSLSKQFRYGYFNNLSISNSLHLPIFNNNPSSETGDIYYNSNKNEIIYFDGLMFRNIFSVSITTINTTTELTVLDKIVLVNASNNNIILILPPVNENKNFIMYIKKIDTTNNIITLNVKNSNEHIDNYASYILSVPNECIQICCDGVDWWILSSKYDHNIS